MSDARSVAYYLRWRMHALLCTCSGALFGFSCTASFQCLIASVAPLPESTPPRPCPCTCIARLNAPNQRGDRSHTAPAWWCPTARESNRLIVPCHHLACRARAREPQHQSDIRHQPLMSLKEEELTLPGCKGSHPPPARCTFNSATPAVSLRDRYFCCGLSVCRLRKKYTCHY